MATQKNAEIIKEPYNPLDPIVVFDPEFNKQIIVKTYENPVNNNPSNEQENALKDDGVNIPVIKVNNVLLKYSNIDYLKITYDSFLPIIHLSVKDDKEIIKNCDTPGLDNHINVVITTPINGYYKKISLSFYITDFKIYENNYISYDGIFKFQGLNTAMFKQIGDKKLSTYDMLELICKETKLGFAATEDCKDIKDEKYRLIRSQTYEEFIKEQMKQSGSDEKSMFDCWVDLFGYLVLVNLYYCMNEDVAPEQLTIHSMVGFHSSSNNIPDVQSVLLQRTLTNNTVNPTEYNLLINKFENEVHNDKIYTEGALNQGYYMTSPGKDNTISNEELQIIENSIDGQMNSEKYEFKKVEFIGIEFEDTSVLFQKKVRNRYFDKLKTKRLKVELTKHNLGLQRGTLVNVILKEYDQGIIKSISNDTDIDESAEGVVNPFTTGMYYIDGMEFEYKIESQEIVQYLYLIKRGSTTNALSGEIEPISLNKNLED